MDTLNGPETALILVHLQNDIAHPDGAFGGFFHEEAVRNVVVGGMATNAEITHALAE